MAIKIKKDKYRATRGGTSKIIKLHCSSCSKFLMQYQKDGPGSLLRCYLDRIMEPAELSSFQEIETFKDIPNLHCHNQDCLALIGVPMVYEKESRFAFRLIRGSVCKSN